jgi:gamma-tubulin complex component 2
MQTCTMFTTFTNWLSRELQQNDPDLAEPDRPRAMNKQHWTRLQAERQRHADPNAQNAAAGELPNAERLEKMFDVIKKFEDNFSRHLQILLDALNHYAATETVVLLGLCARLSTANQGTQYSGLRNDEDNEV